MLPFDGTTLGYMNECVPARNDIFRTVSSGSAMCRRSLSAAPAAACCRFMGSGRAAMQAQLDRDGYLLLRDAIPRELVLAGCASITVRSGRIVVPETVQKFRSREM